MVRLLLLWLGDFHGGNACWPGSGRWVDIMDGLGREVFFPAFFLFWEVVMAVYLLCAFLSGFLLFFALVCLLAGFDVSRLREGLSVIRKRHVVVGDVAEELSGEPFRLFVLLQRESRFMDLLLEDISGYPDDAVGAAVKPVLGKARAVFNEYVSLEPIMAGQEGDDVTIPGNSTGFLAGYDAAQISLVGDLRGAPPFTGVLCHPGWRVKAHKIPKCAPGVAGLVVERAQVEVG
jgi:hypothetical protein